MRVQKRVRLTLEFEVTADVIDETSVQARAETYSNPEEILQNPFSQEMMEANEELRRALLANPVLLDTYLRRTVVEKTELLSRHEVGERIGVSDNQSAEVNALLPELSEKAQAYFRQGTEHGMITEYAQLFHHAFEARLVDVHWQEVPVQPK